MKRNGKLMSLLLIGLIAFCFSACSYTSSGDEDVGTSIEQIVSENFDVASIDVVEVASVKVEGISPGVLIQLGEIIPLPSEVRCDYDNDAIFKCLTPVARGLYKPNILDCFWLLTKFILIC